MHSDDTQSDDMHPDDRYPDQELLDAVGRGLLRGAHLPQPPAELRARALAAARRELWAIDGEQPDEEPSLLDRWIGALFRSRVLWTSWAVAMLLALALGPAVPSGPLPAAAPHSGPDDPHVELASDGPTLAFETPDTNSRPSPSGPLLRDTYATSTSEGAASAIDSWRRPS